MILPFSANKKKSFSWWQLLIIIALVFVFFMMLFSPDLFIHTLLNSKPSQISIQYLKNMVERYPNNLEFKIKLAQQEFSFGEIQGAKQIIMPYVTFRAKTAFQWKVYELYYQIVRVEAFQLKSKSPKRLQKERILKNIIPVLSKSPLLNATQQNQLADDALAQNLPDQAFQLYQIILKNNPNQSIEFYLKAAMAALYIKEYQSSADFYIRAMQATSFLREKRFYYIKAVDAISASGDSEKAWKFAMKYINGLADDNKMKLYLIQLALGTSHHLQAQEYMDQVMQLYILELK